VTCPSGTSSVAGSTQCTPNGVKNVHAPATAPGGAAGPAGEGAVPIATSSTTPGQLRH